MGIKQRGFSLVELMVSMVILSAVMALSSAAYSIYVEGWRKRVGDFDGTLYTMRNQLAAFDAMRSVFPYVVHNNKRPGMFFFGEKTVLDGVTQAGLFNPANAAAFRIRIEDGNLVYFEKTLADILLLTPGQAFTFDRKLILEYGVSDLSFRYYGWANYAAKSNFRVTNQGRPAWSTKYDGYKRQLIPEVVELTYTHNRQTRSLQIHTPVTPELFLERYFDNE